MWKASTLSAHRESSLHMNSSEKQATGMIGHSWLPVSPRTDTCCWWYDDGGDNNEDEDDVYIWEQETKRALNKNICSQFFFNQKSNKQTKQIYLERL